MWQRFAGVRLRWEKAGRAQMNRRIAQMAARWVIRLLMYALLICLSFVLLYPLLYAFSQAFRTQADIYNANVIWIPTAFTWDNFRVLWKGIDYPLLFKNTLLICVGSSLLQTAICAVTGYGFARFRFREKALWMVLLLSLIHI